MTPEAAPGEGRIAIDGGILLKFRKRSAAAVIGLACASALLSSPAQANDYNVSPNQCYDAYYFKFQLFYNSDFKGSWIKFGYSEENFGAYDGTPGYLIYNFCPNRGLGSDKQVKNNAASAHNHKDYGLACVARVHFNSFQKGVWDDIPADHYKNLVNTYNENASFEWRGTQC
ncbi:hypothetical protein ACFQ6B_12690 [Streptomyces wedmorensis]|uniref:Secreted protein n=1 Tax=Streptomyces wedmorensis TaxID=43759 RepID=A0ABW6IVM5_STRWE